jgi:hypothetical protein
LDPDPLLLSLLIVGFIKPFSFGVLISFLSLFSLLLFSALISGSEVAYFSLNPSEKEVLNNSDKKITQQC